MGYHNIFARKQLLEVANELTVELREIKSHPLDDEFDEEHKAATRRALQSTITNIYKRIEALEKQK